MWLSAGTAAGVSWQHENAEHVAAAHRQTCGVCCIFHINGLQVRLMYFSAQSSRAQSGDNLCGYVQARPVIAWHQALQSICQLCMTGLECCCRNNGLQAKLMCKLGSLLVLCCKQQEGHMPADRLVPCILI